MSQFIPPWQDRQTLCRNICASETTIDTWVAQGILPPPRKRGGKLMWKWAEVDHWLTQGTSLDSLAERIKEGSRRAMDEERQGH